MIGVRLIGVSIVLQQLAMMGWGRNYHTFPPLLPATPHQLFGAAISDLQMLIVVVAALLMAALVWLGTRTRLGRAMRATASL